MRLTPLRLTCIAVIWRWLALLIAAHCNSFCRPARSMMQHIVHAIKIIKYRQQSAASTQIRSVVRFGSGSDFMELHTSGTLYLHILAVQQSGCQSAQKCALLWIRSARKRYSTTDYGLRMDANVRLVRDRCYCNGLEFEQSSKQHGRNSEVS